METVATVCGYCGVGCGMELHVADGVVTKATGRADHPANRGRLCTKGNTTADMLRAGGRLTTALVRPERSAEAAPTGVDAAVEMVADRLSAIRDEHGADAIALYVSGQMSIEAQYLANKLAKGYLRTQWIESNSRLCMASAGTGYKQSLGADGPPGSYDDLDTADLFLVLGANMADCHPILYLRMMDRVRDGAKLVVVDPRRTATAAKADFYLPVRPGTDLALLNGLLRLVRDTGGVDTEFVAAFTEGWEPLDAMLDEYPADLVADITGLDEADLRAVAELICGTKNWVSLWTMGLNQSTHGTWNTNALCNLHLATGAICHPGAGPFSLTGQPNAMGGREMGYMGPGLPGQRTTMDPADRTFVEKRWGLEPGTIRVEAGTGTVDMYRRMADGEIRAAWIICTNPVASVSNRAVVIAGLERAELVVVQDAFTGVETAEYADVVLPAALWAEADGVMVNSERTLTHCGPAMGPPGEALPDWQLICRVATAMGYPGFEFDSAADVFAELADFHNPRTGWDLRGVDYQRLRRGPVQWPAAPGCADRNPIRYRNDGISQDLHTADDGTVPALAFPTPSRRARFLPRPYLPAAELPDDEFPLVFTTGRLAHQWHTMTKTGKVAKLNKLNPEPFLQLHPDDADRLGVRDGDKVEIRSRRGRAVLPAAVDEAVRPGVCFAPMHWADAFGPDLAVNAVTNDAVDADSLQPEFKVCAVAVSAVETGSSPTQPTPEVATAPIEALAAALGPLPSPATLNAAEQLYLSGFVAGVRAHPPGDQVPTLPTVAPLAPGNRAWVNGVLAGIFSRTAGSAAHTAEQVRSGPMATVVWASQTGTAEEFAKTCVERLSDAGVVARLRGADEISLSDLAGTVLFVVATTGDGDPPDNGIALWHALAAAEPGDMDSLDFSVLGFGDSSYANFCGFARRLDARLGHLGAHRIVDRVSCEPDFEATAQAWTDRVIAALTEQAPDTPAPKAIVASSYSRTNPLRTTVASNVALCGAGSDKDVRNIGIHLPEGTLEYGPGDALGVWPHNRPDVVVEFLERTGLDGSAEITVGGQSDDVGRILVHASGYHPDHARSDPLRARASAVRRTGGGDRRSRELRRVDRGTPSPRPVGEPPGRGGAGRLAGGAAAIGATPVLDFVESARGPDPSARDHLGRALRVDGRRNRRCRSARRLLGIPGQPGGRRRSGCIHPAHQALSAATGPGYAGDHGGTGYRDRAVPRIPARSCRARACRRQLAVLRRTARGVRVLLPRRARRFSTLRCAHPAGHRVLPRRRKQAVCAGPDAGKRRRTVEVDRRRRTPVRLWRCLPDGARCRRRAARNRRRARWAKPEERGDVSASDVGRGAVRA